MKPDRNCIEYTVDPYQLVSEEFRSHLIRIYTVFPRACTFIIIMESEIQNYFFKLVPGQVNRNFELVPNEMGPGGTSSVWYFHSPAIYVLNKRAHGP